MHHRGRQRLHVQHGARWRDHRCDAPQRARRPGAIRAEGIRKGYGPVVALRDVDLRPRRGEVLGLIGDNGAGKSTLIDPLLELRRRREVSIILIAHNFAHVIEVCDRVNLLRYGRIEYDREVAGPSIHELTDLVAADYRRGSRTPG